MILSNTGPLEEFLRDTIGLATDSLGRGLIERVAHKRMDAAGCAGMEDYVRRLRGDARLRQQLIEDLVVPETWFFRDQEPFVLLAKLAATRSAPLRLLSMPCSTGEEPYSLAMTLLDAGFAPESFCIDAVDISQVSLKVAKQADYGANSFRGDQGGSRNRWFQEVSGRWRLDPIVRSRVTFHHDNLFAFAPTGGRYDFIFCRNVLIYFDSPAQSASVRRLLSLLTEEGVLFVGHAEAAVVLREGLAALPVQRGFAFTRRPVTAAQAPVSPARRPPRSTAQPVAPVRRPFADVKPRPVAAPAGPAPSLELIQALADRGRLDEAVGRAQAHIAAHGPTAAAYHLLAVIQDARGDAAGAELAYRKVLYLNPRHEEAVIHLALLLERRGDSEAVRLRQRMRRPNGRGGDA